MNWERREVYPRNVFWDLVRQFEEPVLEEGFEETVKISFQVSSSLYPDDIEVDLLTSSKWTGNAEEFRIWSKFWI